MATLKRISAIELSKARRAGFKRKRPKKGKLKTLAAAEGYIERYNRWVDDAKAKIREADSKEREKERLKKMKEQIRRV